MKQQAIICVGVPASGKSTWSKEFCKNNKSFYRICRDDMRLMFQDSQMLDWEGETALSSMNFKICEDLLKSGKNIVIDQTNCKFKYLSEWVFFFESKGVDVKVQLFDESLDVVVERNFLRSAKVPVTVILNMYNNLEELKKTFDFKKYARV